MTVRSNTTQRLTESASAGRCNQHTEMKKHDEINGGYDYDADDAEFFCITREDDRLAIQARFEEVQILNSTPDGKRFFSLTECGL